MSTYSIFRIFTWNIKNVSYLYNEGVTTAESGSNKKCCWVINPVLVLTVITGNPICRIQRFMIASTVLGSFNPALSTAWQQECPNISNSTILRCSLRFRGQLHMTTKHILTYFLTLSIFLRGAMTSNPLPDLRTDFFYCWPLITESQWNVWILHQNNSI